MTRIPVAVVMAGGRGTRLGGVIKPLLPVCGEPMLARIVRVAGLVAREVIVAASPYTLSGIRSVARLLGVAEIVMLGGKGYAADMAAVARLVNRRPILFLPSDTPLVSAELLRAFTNKAAGMDGIVTLVAGSRGPIGISMLVTGFQPWHNILVEDDARLINVNTWREYEEANRVCRKLSR